MSERRKGGVNVFDEFEALMTALGFRGKKSESTGDKD